MVGLNVSHIVCKKNAKITGIHGNLLHWIVRCETPELRKNLLDSLLTQNVKFDDGTSQAHIQAALGNTTYFLKDISKLATENRVGVTPVAFAILCQQREVFNIAQQHAIKPVVFKELKEDAEFRELAEHYNHVAQIATHMKNEEQAANAYQQAIACQEKIKKPTNADWRILASYYTGYGMYFWGKQAWDNAINAYQQAIAYREKINKPEHDDWRQLATYSFRCGMIFQGEKAWDKAIDAYQQAITYREKIKESEQPNDDWRELATYSFWCGMRFQGKQAWDQAIKAYQQAITYRGKIKEAEQTDDDLRELATYSFRCGMIFQGEKAWDKAIDAYQQASTYREKINSFIPSFFPLKNHPTPE